MEEINVVLIGQYIRSLRLSKGWSQAKLEKITGLSTSNISNIELGNKGESYNLSLPSLVKIAHALNITLVDLLNQSGFLNAIGEQPHKTNQYPHHELINLYYRLDYYHQQVLISKLKEKIKQIENAKQQKMHSKK